MAQIADVMHASFALDAARQELSCCLLWTDVNRHVISSFMEEMAAVLQEAVMRWRGATGEEETWLIEEVERQSIRDWLMRLKDVTYIIRAVAEDKSSYMSEIEDRIKANLEEITEEYWSFEYERLPLASCMEHPCIGPCVGQETFDVFVGRGYDKQKTFDLLTQAEAEAEAEHPIILPIFGLAGVGKTMLVKQLFQDIRFQDYHKAWVDMSSMYYFDLNEIAASILSQVPGGESYKGELGLHELLQQLLVGGKMKLLVVLDGLWETYPSRLNNLKDLLFGNLIVIVTTASKAIADHMSSAVKPYQLHPLNDDMCLAIIKRTSRFEERLGKDNAVAGERIGLEIATRCGGLPLAAQALGCILQFVIPQAWAACMTWNFGGWHSQPPLLTISVLSHLITAYQHLIQDTESRRCFALCAFIFPKGKGHSIVQHDLIHQFSVFHQYDHFKTAFKRNDHFETNAVCDLLDSSFLLHEKSPSASAEYAYAEESARLTMNDLVHDFARYVLGDRMIVVDGGNGVMPSHVNNSNAFCAIVSNLDDRAQSDLSKILPAGTRAIRFEGCSKMVLGDNAFSFAKGLWFLDLSGCSVQKLPYSIGKLEELRYLNAPGIQDQELPLSLIAGLCRLRYLSLRGSCQLSKLPEALGGLKCLHHLDLSGCLELSELPEALGGLKCLHHLDLSGCSGLQALPESVTECTYLEVLILSDCSGLQALPDPAIKGWQTIYLEHLDLSGCSGLQVLPESIIYTSLRHLDISRCSRLYALPRQFYRLTELIYFNLSCCWELRELPRSISSFPFPYLEHLDLSGCFCVRGIMEALDGLTGLQYLNISHACGYHVEDWFHLKGLDAVLPKLTKLRFLGLSMCLDPFCYALPPLASEKFLEDCITGLDNLQHLDLSKNKFLLSLPVRLGDLKALRTLDLSGCFRLQNLPERISSLIEIHLSGCLQLSTITNDNASYLGEDSSHEAQREHGSLLAGAVENQDMRSTSQDTTLPTDLSAAEPEITQSTDALGKEETESYKQIKLAEIDNYDPNNDPYLT